MGTRVHLSALIVPFQMYRLPIPYALLRPRAISNAGFLTDNKPGAPLLRVIIFNELWLILDGTANNDSCNCSSDFHHKIITQFSADNHEDP